MRYLSSLLVFAFATLACAAPVYADASPRAQVHKQRAVQHAVQHAATELVQPELVQCFDAVNAPQADTFASASDGLVVSFATDELAVDNSHTALADAALHERQRVRVVSTRAVPIQVLKKGDSLFVPIGAADTVVPLRWARPNRAHS